MNFTLPGSAVMLWKARFVLSFVFLLFSDLNAQLIQLPGIEQEEVVLEVASPAYNLSHFTAKTRMPDARWLFYNAGEANHPDAHYIVPERPAPNAIEVLSKRTETSRYYVDADHPTRIFTQSAYGALHYASKNGEWLLIDHRLSPARKAGIYEASRQPLPTGFNVKTRHSFIKTPSGELRFNNWKLYGRTGTTKKLLAKPDWKLHTAGDDGVRITDIFPGIDAVMMVNRGQIKTNLIIKSWAFGEFDEILLEDTFEFDTPLTTEFLVKSGPENRVGEVRLAAGLHAVAEIGKAVSYAEATPGATAELPYELAGNSVAIVIHWKLLREMLANGPMLVDPLVVGADSRLNGPAQLNSFNNSSDNQSNCSGDFAEGCSYQWQVEVPARTTVTNATFWARIETMQPCTRDRMSFKYSVGDGTCGRNVTWTTRDNPVSPGITGGEPTSTHHYNACFDSHCETSYTTVSLSILRNCMGDAGCGADCVRGLGPFIITVEGHTLERVSAGTLSESSICYGEEITLAGGGEYGKKDYTYRWAPGNISGDTVTVRPEQSTQYTLTVTDACGNSLSDQVDVEVSAPARAVSMDVEECGELEFEGTRYTSSQTVLDTIAGSRGCDSLYRTVSIVVHPLDPKEEIIDLSGCDFVDFEGSRYYATTVLEETFHNANGCDSIYRKVYVDVEDFQLSLVSSIHPDSLFVGQVTELRAEGNRSAFQIISWEPPHLFSDQSSPSQQISVPTDLTYTVQAETANGCPGLAVMRLLGRIIPNSGLYPNSFSPNGDGTNDTWKPVRRVDDIEVWVYNRWGECVFHSDAGDHHWDGTYKGAKVPEGSYTFRFVAYKRFESSGIVNVIY